MRYLIIALALLLGPVLSARAQLSVDIGLPGVNIGINMPVYPDLVRIPGYPVYYDPRVNSNYFFYDGLYWVYAGDNWYASTWYNGPWDLVGPEEVPQFLLLVPVRYYRSPPVYFRGWSSGAAPHWGEHWGRSWEQRRAGWDRWDRHSVPIAAPLPVYQRQYSGDRYPRAIQQQQVIQSQNYRYQPRDAVAQQHFRQGAVQGGQAQGNAGRARVQPQQPVQQGSANQTQQHRLQASQQQQQQQQLQQQQRQPTQTLRQARPAQAAVQRAQNGPQEKGPVNAGSPQAKGPAQMRAAPREMKAAPQAKAAENRPGPQGNGAGNRGGPQEAKGGPKGGAPDKGARQDKGQENKKE